MARNLQTHRQTIYCQCAGTILVIPSPVIRSVEVQILCELIFQYSRLLWKLHGCEYVRVDWPAKATFRPFQASWILERDGASGRMQTWCYVRVSDHLFDFYVLDALVGIVGIRKTARPPEKDHDTLCDTTGLASYIEKGLWNIIQFAAPEDQYQHGKT